MSDLVFIFLSLLCAFVYVLYLLFWGLVEHKPKGPPKNYAQVAAERTMAVWRENSARLSLREHSAQPHRICDTGPCCECVGPGGLGCDCRWNAYGTCVTCGAPQVLIDFETGDLVS